LGVACAAFLTKVHRELSFWTGHSSHSVESRTIYNTLHKSG
jgi:hypothetical protein